MTSCEKNGDADRISISIDSDSSFYYKPITIQVSGIQPSTEATLKLKFKDEKNYIWTSEATFLADKAGTIDPSIQPSLGGNYTGVHPMGLFWSAKCDDYHQVSTGTGFMAFIDVVANDSVVASDSTYRISTREFNEANLEVLELNDTVVAEYYKPKDKESLPAIIFLGGSGGQFRSERASLFATEGFAVLDLKYFNGRGLPDGIVEVPLEYIHGAFNWLKNRPEINQNRIGIMGRSMGSQPALLYASEYHGVAYVVVEAPSSVVWFGWEEGKSSFTHRNISFPYAEYTDEESERIELKMRQEGVQYHDGPKFLSAFQDSAMISRASIPVEKIECPILFISGADDKMWPSAMMAERMMDRLANNNFNYPYLHKSYDDAGHNFAGGGQGCGIPYLPPEDYSESSAKGGTNEGNAIAAIESWNDILAFIRK